MIDEDLIEDSIIEFSDQLKTLVFHPRKRFQLLKAYVSALVPDGNAEGEVKDPATKFAEITRLLPSPFLLSPYIGVDHRNEIAVGTLVESLNHLLMNEWCATPQAREYLGKASLYLQVEVVKASSELEAMEDDNINTIRQDQEIDVDDDNEFEEEEEIEQDYDIQQEKEDVLESEIQNLAFILGQHTTSPLEFSSSEEERKTNHVESLTSEVSEVQQQEQEQTSEKKDLKQIRQQLQSSMVATQSAQKNAVDKLAQQTQKDQTPDKKPPEGRSR